MKIILLLAAFAVTWAGQDGQNENDRTELVEKVSYTPEQRLALLRSFASEKKLTLDAGSKVQIVCGNFLDFSLEDLKKIIDIAQEIALDDNSELLTGDHIFKAALNVLKDKAKGDPAYLIRLKALINMFKKQQN